MTPPSLHIPGWTADEMLQLARRSDPHLVCGCPQHLAGADDPDLFDWYYYPDLPIERICGSRELWTAWYAEEVRGAPDASAQGSDYYRALEAHWPANRRADPLVLVEGSDRRLHVWDGCHRTGISHTLGEATVSAVVGVLRTSLHSPIAVLREAVEGRIYPYGVRDRALLKPGQFIFTQIIQRLDRFREHGASPSQIDRFLFDTLMSGGTPLKSGSYITLAGWWDTFDAFGRRLCRPVVWIGPQDWDAPVHPPPTLEGVTLYDTFRRTFDIPSPPPPPDRPLAPEEIQRLDGGQWSLF